MREGGNDKSEAIDSEIVNSRDPLQCTFEDASRETLLAGIALDTEAKVNFFEEMVSLAHAFGASDRLVPREAGAIDDAEDQSSSDLENKSVVIPA